MISHRAHDGVFALPGMMAAENLSASAETSAHEMQRLIRQIAGKATAGEKDDQLRARAMRRLNMALRGDRQIGPRRARAYWYAEIADVPADHMDRAREVAFILPIEEALDAAAAAEQFIDGLRARLASLAGGGGHAGTGSAEPSARGMASAADGGAGIAALVPSPAALRVLTGVGSYSSQGSRPRR